MKIVLSGGGTGGHIYPALALKNYILTQYPETEFLYIGSERGLEREIVSKENIPFQSIKIQGIKRSLSLENIKAAWYMLRSTSHAKKILTDFQPDIVIGTGGYVCGPVLYAAAKLHIPSIIHEQNSVAGITNKFLSRYVTKICTCFDTAKHDFQKYANKVVLTGNPRGQELVSLEYQQNILEQIGLKKDKSTVLIFGGSRGAMNLNKHFISYINDYTTNDYQVILVTGNAHYQSVIDSLETIPDNIKVLAYIDNMPDILRAVDLVVCRSGATTLAELTALGVASILIPSPYVTNNHQEKNAQTLVDKGAAFMVLEKELAENKLAILVNDVMQHEEKQKEMAHHAKELGITNASERLLTIIKECVQS
ncbi:undecaprenyldiphospho-muramoylpentapeptide beta-N-acetylglucosaminyltransferase [Carnobacteriaceae bacterium zg-ZUI78]|nr:undecaprenyldiphospho-muramoylpentapeptide beta-N-acetylglucosaminyltransferase [Carnobacteriaceae bacterium zg-ZUI78]